MKVTILQRNIEWANPALNVQRADEAIDRNPGADLYVLPEMFSTGFCTRSEERHVGKECRSRWSPYH